MRLASRPLGTACCCALLVACGGSAPLRDFPATSDTLPSAVFALRSADCDGNLAALTVFEQPAIAARVELEGVVLVDGDSAEPRLREQLRAYDVGVPPLHLSRATRDSLARFVEQLGPTFLILDRRTHTLRAIPAPQSPRQLMQLTAILRALPARNGATR